MSKMKATPTPLVVLYKGATQAVAVVRALSGRVYHQALRPNYSALNTWKQGHPPICTNRGCISLLAQP
jgi:hypothetical protein